MQFRYSRDGGDIVYAVDGQTRFRAEEIALCYTEPDDPDDLKDVVTLHKHGPVDAVQEWYNQKRPIFDKIGIRLKMISSSEWDADDLDRFINCTGSLGPWLRKHGMLGSQPTYLHEQSLQHPGAEGGLHSGRDQEGVPAACDEVAPGQESG